MLAVASALYGLFFLFAYVPRLQGDLRGFADWIGQLLTSGNLRQRIDSPRSDVVGTVIRQTDRFVSSVQATVQGMADVAAQVGDATRDVGRGVQQVQDAASKQNMATASATA
ncbi:MAG TPA: chemotaxis protein, partial [Candidatus Accumulibacter sp.]|nr:chemotaxis protein [Accumulibacter sp.]